MKKQMVLIILISLAIGACAKKSDKLTESQSLYCQSQKLSNEYIVHWKSSYVELIKEENINDWIQKHDQQIEMVEPNYAIPNKLHYSEPIESSELYNTAVHKIIDSEYAWQNGHYGQGIVVAVVDSGVDTHQPRLESHIAVNAIEYKFGPNQIDDDNNGYVDDIYGWNAISPDKRPFDEIGHGTAMAGIITGPLRSPSSLSIAPRAKIVPVDFMTGNVGTEYHAREALAYAVTRKVNIINNSWSINCSELLKNSFISWQNENIIFVNAAGNTPMDVSQIGLIPASLNLPNHIHVGSSDYAGNRSFFSGYGSTVRILAPGESVVSLNSTNNVEAHPHLTGTSVSTAIVSASAAIIWEAYPHLKAPEVIALLHHGASTSPSGEKIVNLKGALLVGNYLFREPE